MSLRQAHKERTRAALVAAAFELLEEHGFDALTADVVADRAGVSRRTLFNYFGSVEEVLVHPDTLMLERFLDRLRESNPDTSPLEFLREHLPAVVTREDFERIALLTRCAREHSGLRRVKTDSMLRCRDRAVELFLEHRREAGGAPDRLFVFGLAHSGLGVMETAGAIWFEETGGLGGATSRARYLELVETALEHLRSGFGTPPAGTA